MKGYLRRFSMVVLGLLLASSTAWAQATAQLNGRVVDESGASLPGVTVTVTQTDTALTRTTVTDEGGGWSVTNLPVGPYRLELMLEGFRAFVQTGITLTVNANPVINATMALGNLQETVTVEGAAPLVDVRSAGISEVVEQERIVELPLQTRNVTDLIVLAGGAVNTGRVSALSTSGSVGISVAGGLRNGVEYQLDGAAHNSPHDLGNLPFPFPDALQEFSVASGGLAAATGMHSGASVNAVTKSGTNVFRGNAFEFFRDQRFNSKAYFASIDPDTGEKRGDGLSKNQFGGTLGGPIVSDRLFFFAGYERNRVRQTTQDNLAFLPTAAMLAGDFSAYASPACNNGQQINLRAPFVNNQINPAQLSAQALRVVNSGLIPRATNPCGNTLYAVNFDNNDEQYVLRGDFQLTANHQIFARYFDTFERRPPMLDQTRNLLTIQTNWLPYRNRRAQMLALGDTQVLGANTVNSLRFTFASTKTRANGGGVDGDQERYFSAADLGIPNIYTYVPGTVAIWVGPTGQDLRISGNHTVAAKIDSKIYQFSEDFSRVVGRHQLGVGTNVQYTYFDGWDYAGANGTFQFNGTVTGLALADFLTGQMSSFGHSAPQINTNNQWYLGVYGQDTWRVGDRVTLNLGVRWDPYFGTIWKNGTISNFSMDNFRNGVVSTAFPNAPPGLIYPGDAGFPNGKTGTYPQYTNISPRVGAAWDVRGDGRMALRSSYALNYDFPGGAYQQPAANVPPFNLNVNLTQNGIPFADPYSLIPGGAPQHPVQIPAPSNSPFPGLSSYSSIEPDTNSIRVQSWNATIEQQVGDVWQVAASYLGSHIDRIWGRAQINEGQFLGLGPCTLNGVSYATCTTRANLQARRAFNLENPVFGRSFSTVYTFTNLGIQDYTGLKLSLRRRAAAGVSLAANYTWSTCTTDSPYGGRFVSDFEYTNPDDPRYDKGNCPFNRTHIAAFTLGYQTPRFDNTALRLVGSDWRVSGVLNAQSGDWLTVTTTQDPVGSGIGGQRVNQVSDDVYGQAEKLPNSIVGYLNRAAFTVPAQGTYGDHKARSITGPGYWNVDLALARVLTIGGQRSFEIRVETFNLFNNFNWGNPNTSIDSPQFGIITSQNGNPRVMQFALKYAF